MRTLFLSFFFIFVTEFPIMGQTAHDILSLSIKEIENQHSVHYSAIFRMKFFSGDDTMRFEGNGYLYRVWADSFFGGYVKISLNDSACIFSDLTNIYDVNHIKKSATKYDLKKGEQWSISSNMNGRMIWKYFLQPHALKELEEPDNVLNKIRDTVINGKHGYFFSAKLPDQMEFTNRIVSIIFDEKYLPISISGIVEFQGNYQYTHLQLQSYGFDTVNENIFSEKSIPSFYTVKAYEDKKQIEQVLPDSGSVAPTLSGKRYPGLIPDTIVYSGKVTLLDFWYMGCFPCIKTIPILTQLLDKFKNNSFQIVGVNNYNNNDKDISKLHNFMTKNHMGYSTILVDDTLVKKFNISSWPTFFLINSKGNIIYTEIGHSDILFDNLEQRIQQALRTSKER